MVCVEFDAKSQVTFLRHTCSVLNDKSSQAAGAISEDICSRAVLRKISAHRVHVKIVSSVAVDADSVVVVALAVDVGFVSHWRAKSGICVLRTSSVDAHASVRSITLFAHNTVSSFIPFRTVLDHIHTNIFPLGASLKTLDTVLLFLIPIFAQTRPLDVRHEVLASHVFCC